MSDSPLPPADREDELRELFFESAAEIVQQINEEALRLEQRPGDDEATRSLRRTVHTLKGDAAACGFRELSELCHEFEDVLTLGDAAGAASVPEIALRAADVFTALLEAYREDTKLPSLKTLRADIARLAQIAGGTADSSAPAGGKNKGKRNSKSKSKNKSKTRWSEYEQLAIAQALAEGRRIHHVIVKIDRTCGMPLAGRQMIQLALKHLGEVLALYPGEGSHDPMADVEAALASDKTAEQIRAKCSIPTIAAEVQIALVPAPGGAVGVDRGGQ